MERACHAAGVASIAVVDADGARQVVRLKDPLALPPAKADAVNV